LLLTRSFRFPFPFSHQLRLPALPLVGRGWFLPRVRLPFLGHRSCPPLIVSVFFDGPSFGRSRTHFQRIGPSCGRFPFSPRKICGDLSIPYVSFFPPCRVFFSCRISAFVSPRLISPFTLSPLKGRTPLCTVLCSLLHVSSPSRRRDGFSAGPPLTFYPF